MEAMYENENNYFIFWIFFYISVAFTEGCDVAEPKPDYIIVVVKVSGLINYRNLNTSRIGCDSLGIDVPMRIVITKDGGDHFIFFLTTGPGSCYYNSEQVSFKLYKEQPIEVDVSTEYVPAGYTQSEGYSILEWEDVFPGKYFGETYSWQPSVDVFWLFN